jgi:hypothetical protein
MSKPDKGAKRGVSARTVILGIESGSLVEILRWRTEDVVESGGDILAE